MAEITTTPKPTTTDMGGVMDIVMSPINFIGQHFIFFTIMTFIVVAFIVIIVLWMKKNEELREQEDTLYKEFKDTTRTCRRLADEKMYVRYWSKWNLLWLGLPLIKRKLGRGIYDLRQQHYGYYDGFCVDLLGNVNILMWKTKTFIFFKDYEILRIPQKAYSIRQVEIKKKKQTDGPIQDNEPKFEQKVEVKTIPQKLWRKSDLDMTIIVDMIGMTKRGFYYYPVFVDGTDQMLDLTETINAMNQINHSNILLEQVIKEAGKQVVNMAKVNAPLQYEQRRPNKVRDVDNEDAQDQQP